MAVSQPTILGTSIVQAWLFPVDTSDHSADEHRVERIMVLAGAPTAGVGFNVFARVDAEQVSAPETLGPSRFRSAAATVFGFVSPSGGGLGSLLYGKWTVAWRWS